MYLLHHLESAVAFWVVCTGWVISGVVGVSRGFDGLVSPDLGFPHDFKPRKFSISLEQVLPTIFATSYTSQVYETPTSATGSPIVFGTVNCGTEDTEMGWALFTTVFATVKDQVSFLELHGNNRRSHYCICSHCMDV